MKEFLTGMLICPGCLPEELPLQPDIVREQKGDILEGTLTCAKCGNEYPIRDGIAYLDHPGPREDAPESKYETAPLLSSYLWSHYGDLLGDEEALPSYRRWGELMNACGGGTLDLGSAVGRFAFEMSLKSDFVVGVDNSVSFIRAARELAARGRKEVALRQEGILTREETILLPGDWQTDKVEFIVGDALSLPFRSRTFSSIGSLNRVDKVALPLKHLEEVNRVARETGAQFLLSDPFSWSEEAAREGDWLGGKAEGRYAGRGLDNISALLQGEKGPLIPPWRIAGQGHVWWKIRTHANHFELIRSCFVKAQR